MKATTGILRLQPLNRAGKLMFPMMLVNNADCKHLFDNRYGTGQSVWDGINRTTNLIVAGKNVVVAGYGWCGKGVAMRAKGLGAEVIVTEVDVAALRRIAVSETPARKNIVGYTLENGRRIYVIAEGRLVNLAAGDGHPAEIMDMSFAIQAMSARYLVLNREKICREPGRMLSDVPREIDLEVASKKLAAWGCEIDVLTPEQHQYLYGC